MSYCLLSETAVRAQKPYRCIWCDQRIEKGERYVRECSIYDGDIQNHKWHPECINACHAEYMKTGEEELYPGENERPDIGFYEI